MSSFGYNFKTTVGDVHIYENTNYLPLGFIYRSYYLLEDFKHLPVHKKDAVLVNAVILDNEGKAFPDKMEKFDVEKVKCSQWKKQPIEAHNPRLQDNISHGNKIEFSVNVKANDQVCLNFKMSATHQIAGSIDCVDTRGKVYKNVRRFNIRPIREIAGPGRRYKIFLVMDKDIKTIILRFEREIDFKIGKVLLKTKHMDAEEKAFFKHSIQTLKKDTLKIGTLKGDHIEGDIFLDEPGFFFLSIPFDKGWKLNVDGKERELEKANIGFIGTFLEKGFHRIELKYTPPLFYRGLFITLFSLGLFFVLLFIQNRFTIFSHSPVTRKEKIEDRK